jgi:heptosyltransferase-2
VTVASPVIRPETLRRVLVRFPNWLGDSVMALPVVRALGGLLPVSELTCVGPWTPLLLAGEPGVSRTGAPPRGFVARLAEARRLRRPAFDLALLLTNSFETALLARVAGARVRVGYASDGRRSLLTHAVEPPGAPRHQVDQYLDLLAPLGWQPGAAVPPVLPSLVVSPERRVEARGLLAGVGVSGGTAVVGIQLGAAFGPAKLWPAERLAGLVGRIEAAGVPAVFLGRADAGPLLAAIGSYMTGAPRSLVGLDTPALLPALLAELTVLVTPDTGPAHLAAAVGVAVVTLFGPTDPRLTAPRGPGVTAIWRKPSCAPCFRPRCPIDHRCLAEVSEEEVGRTVLGVLSGRREALAR